MEQQAILRGNYAAKIDDKGRLKIPNAFKAVIQAQHGPELFVTSLTGEWVTLYPMPVWVALEQKLAQVPSTLPARQKYLDRVNYFGQVAEIDSQGRVLIHQRLREAAAMAGEVDVFGQYNVLGVWNHERIVAKLQHEAYTEADASALADFGI